MLNFLRSLVAVAGVLLCIATSPAFAQAGPELDPLEGDVVVTNFEDYGVVSFESDRELYGLATAPGRCPVGTMADQAQPCALLLEELVSGTGKKYLFKPIFKVVSKEKILAMHDSRFRKEGVSARALYSDVVSVKDAFGNEFKSTYVSIGIVGNDENRNNCAAGRKCLTDVLAEDPFLAYLRLIPPLVIDMLWNGRRIDPSMKVTLPSR